MVGLSGWLESERVGKGRGCMSGWVGLGGLEEDKEDEDIETEETEGTEDTGLLGDGCGCDAARGVRAYGISTKPLEARLWRRRAKVLDVGQVGAHVIEGEGGGGACAKAVVVGLGIPGGDLGAREPPLDQPVVGRVEDVEVKSASRVQG